MAKYARPVITTLKRDEPLTGAIQVALDANNVARNIPLQPPNNIVPNDRFIWGFTIRESGRITNNNANNPTGVMPDGLLNLMDTIILRGTDKQLGKKVDIINVHGSSIRELARVQAGQQAAPPGLVPAAPATGPGGVTDYRVYWPIPLTGLNLPVHQQVDHLFDAVNWDALTLILQQADDQSVYTYGAARGLPTFSAFGSATGNPQITILFQYAMGGGKMFEGFKPARIYRYFSTDTSADVQATGTKQLLQNMMIPRGRKIRSVLLKTGTINPNIVAAGNTVFNTLSNALLTNLLWQRGTNRPVRIYNDQFDFQEMTRDKIGAVPGTGYNLLDFAPNGNIKEVLDLTGAISGPTGDILTQLQSDVTTLGSTSAVEAMWEEIEGPPVYPQVA